MSDLDDASIICTLRGEKYDMALLDKLKVAKTFAQILSEHNTTLSIQRKKGSQIRKPIRLITLGKDIQIDSAKYRGVIIESFLFSN